MSSRLRIAAQFAALLLVLSISACARPIGDFGRPIPDPTPPVLRSVRAFISPGSVFNLTDQEKEMRDRVWRYLVSPEDYDWFGDSISELERIGFGYPRFHAIPSDRYYRWLHSTSFASSPVRYARLSDDIKADLGTMPAVFRSICMVDDIDRQRDLAINGLPAIEQNMRVGTKAQRAENLAVIGWFANALTARFQSYEYALNHLLVETPHEEAMLVDANLTDLEVYVEDARSGEFCASDLPRSVRGAGDIGSRSERSSIGEARS